MHRVPLIYDGYGRFIIEYYMKVNGSVLFTGSVSELVNWVDVE